MIVNDKINELVNIYTGIKEDIIKRMDEFDQIWKEGNDERIFEELIFCIFTPQSNAIQCWNAVLRLKKNNLLFFGQSEDIEKKMSGVRFHKTKSNRLIKARNLFKLDGKISIKRILKDLNTPNEMRVWLTENVSGIGWKEASHFLRNIGLGGEFTILDRHILRNLTELNIITKIPNSLSKKLYLEIEEKFHNFSSEIDIPISHLDFVFWYNAKNFIYK